MGEPTKQAMAAAERIRPYIWSPHHGDTEIASEIDAATGLPELTRRASLDAEVVRVLEPFAAMAARRGGPNDSLFIRSGDSEGTAEITVGDLRAAAELLKKMKGDVLNG